MNKCFSQIDMISIYRGREVDNIEAFSQVVEKLKKMKDLNKTINYTG